MGKIQEWKEARGTLVKKLTGTNGKTVLHFMYTADDKHYIWKATLSQKLPSFLRTPRLEQRYEQEAKLKRMPLGSKLILLYNPANPRQCTLAKRAELGTYPPLG